jgi:hypothetical protein
MSLVFVPIQYFNSKTTTFTSPSATQIVLPTADLNTLNTILSNTGFTSVQVYDGINLELMFVNGVTGGAANVTRGVEGTTAVPLAAGATVRFVWTTTGIQFEAGNPTAVTCAGHDAVTVTGGPNYEISAPIVTVEAGPGIDVTGSFPAFTVTNTSPGGATGPAGPTGPSPVLTGSGTVVVSPIAGGYNIDVPPGALGAGSGISLSGSWPNIVITNTQTQGGTGTVTNLVAGNGIAISGGTPTINPTVSLTNTGIAAGTYGGITVTVDGRISAIAAGFVTSIASLNVALVVSTPSVGTINLNLQNGTDTTPGILQLAPTSAAGSNDPSNTTMAVTPAGINSVVASLPTSSTTISVTGNQVALGSSSYTNIVPGIGIVMAVPAGKSVLLDVFVEVVDPSNPTVVQSFAMGIFNGAVLLAGNSQIPSCTRNLKYLINGVFGGTITVNTTALTGTQVLGSYSISTIGN